MHEVLSTIQELFVSVSKALAKNLMKLAIDDKSLMMHYLHETKCTLSGLILLKLMTLCSTWSKLLCLISKYSEYSTIKQLEEIECTLEGPENLRGHFT